MKKTRFRKDIKSSKCFSCPLKLDSENLSKNYEKLTSHKISLELLLSEIKTSEIAVLSNSDKSLNKIIIRVLLDLKDNLKQMLEENQSKEKILEKKITDKKTILQKQLFKINKNEPQKNKKETYEKNKNINISNLKSEIFLLKTLNFMAENYIKEMENIIIKKHNEYNYIKLCMYYTTIEEKEIVCKEQKYYPLVTKLLHKEIFDVRKKFKLVVSTKQYQNDEIETTNQNLMQLKDFIGKKKNGYMDNKEIIPEESKEFTQSITLNRMANNINNLMNIYNKQKPVENEYGDNIIIIDNLDDESFNSNEMSDLSKNEKNKKLNINNNIHQLINLNMNINFNVNFDKFFGNDYVIYNSDRNNKDIIDLLNKNKKKKGLSSTGSLPNIFIDNIKDDNLEFSINESKNKMNDTNSVCKFNNTNNNSKEIINKDYLITN